MIDLLLSKVGKKGLVTLPSKVREFLSIDEGDYLLWKIDEASNTVSVEAVKDPLKALRGKYSDSKLAYGEVEEPSLGGGKGAGD